MRENAIYRFRHIARVVLEAETPLAVGSGEKDIMTDALVATDANDLPYIPGTALAGVLRHALTDDVAEDFFGYNDKNGGMGSEIIFSDAKMVGKDGKVVDGLQTIDFNDGIDGTNDGNKDNGFYNHFLRLPIRQHVRIGHRGVAEQGGKFDEQVVFKGTRFCFEVELLAKEAGSEAKGEPGKSSASENFNKVLAQLGNKTFRIGGGTRKGFGKMKVISCQSRCYDLTKTADLEAYLQHNTCLSEPCEGFKEQTVDSLEEEGWTSYNLTLKPDDFFLMGSGVGDDKVDMTAVKATIITWDEPDKPEFKTKTLIPATSIKGALAHRVAYHYNRLKKICADKIDDGEFDKYVGSNNFAVKTLFGEAADSGGGQKGNVIFSDIIEGNAGPKIFNHVSIDRFTGGAIDGALFAESPVYGKGRTYTTELLVKFPDKTIQLDDPGSRGDAPGEGSAEECDLNEVRQAFELALLDLTEGLLPLGGGVNRGHGVFTGTVKRDGTALTRDNINHTNTI